MPHCEICSSTLDQIEQDWAIGGRRCPRCGEFRVDTITDGLRVDTRWFADGEKEKMVRLSGWIREQNAAGSVPTLTNDLINRIIAIPRPDLKTRSTLALSAFAKMDGAITSVVGQRQAFQNPELLGSSYCVDANEAEILFRIMRYESFLNPTTSGSDLALSIQGILELEKMATTGGQFAQGFVAMWFNPEFDVIWSSGFDPAIRKAGYRPFRIDKKDYIGGITDEIIAEIRHSRFVVADYTEQVNGVYFEAGFALGLGLHVIPTCRADQIGTLHFDIRHLNTLPWSKPDDLIANLSKRIVAVVGAGPFIKERD